MRNKFFSKVFLISFFVYSVVASSKLNSKPPDDIYDRINRNLQKFGEVYREVTLNYVDEINTDMF